METELKKVLKRLQRKLNAKGHSRTIRGLIDECEAAYDALEEAHYAWVDYLNADKPDPEAAKQYLTSVDSWLKTIDDEYDAAIKTAAEMLPADAEADTSLDTSVASEKAAPPPSSVTLDLSEAMAEKLLPPSICCMIFGENPRDWPLFEVEFEVNVKFYVKDERKLVSYLLKFTCGKARACVKPHVISGSKTPFSDAWKELKEMFGAPAVLARYIINDLKDGPSVVSADELLEFARDIKQAVDQLNHTPHENDIKSHTIIEDLLVRLAPSVHDRWRKSALKHKVAKEIYPDINDFLKFIQLLAAESNDEYYGIEASKRRAAKSSVRFKEKKSPKKFESNINYVSSSSPQEIQNAAIISSPQTGSVARKALPSCCLFCKGARHDLKSCVAFLSLDQSGRWGENLTTSKICWKCLSVSCTLHSKCKVTNPCSCAMPFHYLLHPPPCSAQSAQKAPNVNDNNLVMTNASSTILPTIEIVCGKKSTYALQDSASTASYIEEDLVKELNLKTFPSENYTRTINGVADTNHRIVKSIKVRGKGQCTYHVLKNVLVCSRVPATTRTVALDPADYTYLEGLTLDAQRSERVGLLIGSDSGLNRPLACKEHPTEPKTNLYAIKYPLGWAIAGPLNNFASERSDTNDCAFIDCHFQSAPVYSSESGKERSESTKTERDLRNGEYVTRPSNTPCHTGKSVRAAPQASTCSTVSVFPPTLGRGGVRVQVPPFSGTIIPDEPPELTIKSKYENTTCLLQFPGLQSRNYNCSKKILGQSSRRRPYAVLPRRCCCVNTTPSRGHHLRKTSRRRRMSTPDSPSGKKNPATNSTGSPVSVTTPASRHDNTEPRSSSPKDVTQPQTDDTGIITNVSEIQEVTKLTADTAVKTSTFPDLTNIIASSLRESIYCWSTFIYCLLIHASITLLCKTVWAQKSSADRGKHSYNIMKTQHLYSMIILTVFCANLISLTADVSLQASAPPASNLTQERDLTSSSLFYTMAAAEDQSRRPAHAAEKTSCTQERSLIHAESAIMMFDEPVTTRQDDESILSQHFAQKKPQHLLISTAVCHFISFTWIYTGKVYSIIPAILLALLITRCESFILNIKQSYSHDANIKPVVLNRLMKMKPSLKNIRLRWTDIKPVS